MSNPLRQWHPVQILACLASLLVLCALTACGSGNPGTPGVGNPEPELSTRYPALQTAPVPLVVTTVGPTLAPATAEALATEDAATATQVALAQATATTVQATQEAVVRATWFARATKTTEASEQQLATRQIVETQEVQATKTAYADQIKPNATIVKPTNWGGDGIGIRMLKDTVQIRLNCDSGLTFVPFAMDASGAFDLPGTYWWCPVVCFGELPAHFYGQLSGSQMTLTIAWQYKGETQTSEPYTVIIGQEPKFNRACPRCLAGNTLIDTPNGPMQVKDLREGMLVWTHFSDVGTPGSRRVTTILKTSRTKVAADHKMVHLVLADGHELFASPAHPAADGRLIGSLASGDLINGTRVASVALVPYHEDYTYDILPSGATGTYWANGILVGSTLTVLTARP